MLNLLKRLRVRDVLVENVLTGNFTQTVRNEVVDAFVDVIEAIVAEEVADNGVSILFESFDFIECVRDVRIRVTRALAACCVARLHA